MRLSTLLLLLLSSLVGAGGGCANPPPEDDTELADGYSADGGAAEGCLSHAECADGDLCIFDGMRGHCGATCELTGTCPAAPPAGGEAATGAPDGAPCAVSGDCAGGTCLAAAQGYPSGLCTTQGCNTAADCHGPASVCLDTGTGLRLCVPTCVTDTDCRLGYACSAVAGGGYCSPSSEPPAPAPPTQAPTAPAPGTEPAPEPAPEPVPEPGPTSGAAFQQFCDGVQVEDNFYGDGWDRYTLQFDVPQSVIGFQLITGAARGFGGFDALNGERLNVDFLNDFDRVNMLIPEGDTVNAIQFPHQAGITPDQLTGRFTLRIAAQDVPYCPILVTKTSPGTRVDLNVTLAPGNGVPDAANAANDPQLQDVIRRAANLYAPAGMTLRAVNYRNLSANEQARFAIIRTEGDITELFRTTLPLGESVDQALTLNLVIVQQILLDEGNVLGVSGGIPGPAGAHGYPTSGVVMTAAVLADPELGSQTMAHELGHFLGLYHTTEVDSVMADPLTDTPECPSTAWQDPELPCPDFQNLMFPYAHPGADISAQQVGMLHASPLVK